AIAWCERRDLNSHALRRQNLNLVRLPIPPRSQRQADHYNVLRLRILGGGGRPDGRRPPQPGRGDADAGAFPDWAADYEAVHFPLKYPVYCPSFSIGSECSPWLKIVRPGAPR